MVLLSFYDIIITNVTFFIRNCVANEEIFEWDSTLPKKVLARPEFKLAVNYLENSELPKHMDFLKPVVVRFSEREGDSGEDDGPDSDPDASGLRDDDSISISDDE
jgi:hypothetical protein